MNAIEVKNLTKVYKLYPSPKDRLKEILGGKKRHRDFTALNDVTFNVEKGQTVGIIGRNGSGKSTLLKIICSVLQPTSGSVKVTGRISSLLELGAGFNPAFTGRENVLLNGALMGFSRKEMEQRLPEIEAFADIGEFIEQPVKIYSSGMQIRLAFAAAINVDPEIVVVDEALAVGDMNFKAKCMTALTRIQERGATVLFVSHDIGALKSLCSQGIYLEQGVMKAIGKAPDVAEQYLRTMREEMNAEHRKVVRDAPGIEAEHPGIKNETVQTTEKSNAVMKRSDEFDKRVATFRYGSGGARITYVELHNMSDEPIQLVEFNQEVNIRIYVESSSEQKISVNFNIMDEKKINLTGSNFIHAGHELLQTAVGGGYLAEYRLRLPLQEGIYSVRAQITSPVTNDKSAEFLDVIDDAVVFRMSRWRTTTIWSKIHLFPELNLKRLT